MCVQLVLKERDQADASLFDIYFGYFLKQKAFK